MSTTMETSNKGIKVMNKMIFVNLAVKDLPKSIAFFTALGYTFNPQFSDESGTCMIISDTIYTMLLTEDKFRSFAPGALCDAHKQTEALICLSCDSKAEVDEMVKKAVAAGGTTYKDPIDFGFMYGHSFRDLDGHCWELTYMDPNAVQ